MNDIDGVVPKKKLRLAKSEFSNFVYSLSFVML